MNEERFWEIVETVSDLELEEREALLALQLEKLSNDELEAFNEIWHAKMRAAYTWDLWAAGFVVIGGCSDDAFTEFRNWIISEGREVFAAAVSDPDSLAVLVEFPLRTERSTPWPMLPEADLLPQTILAGRDGKNDPFEAFALDAPHYESGILDSPSGIRFEETRECLSIRLPRLWEKFGGDWIEVFEQK